MAFQPDAVSLSFPDGSGDITVEAPAGSFESGASILIINVTNGIVTSGTIQSDGSFSIKIRAAITDEIQIRIRDSSDRETVIDKTEFHGPDGQVAIGRKGGKIEQGEFVLEVPEGALSTASIFKLIPVAQDVIDGLPLPEGALEKGAAVELDTGGAILKKEAKLSFPVPPGAPEDADFLLARPVVRNSLTLYETIDSASLKNGKITTNSYPFIGVLLSGVYVPISYPRTASGKSVLGVITGIAQETDAKAVDPTTDPLADVEVRIDEPALDGNFIARTRADGHFALTDLKFTGSINLIAKHGEDENLREISATAFLDPNLLSQFPNLERYGRVAGVVFNFPLSPDPPPPSTMELTLFRVDEQGTEIEITDGFVTVGDELVFYVVFNEPPDGVSLAVNDVPVVLERVDTPEPEVPEDPAPEDPDPAVPEAPDIIEWRFMGRFEPAAARGYAVIVSAVDAFLRPLSIQKNFLAITSGSDNEEALPGPPSVITDSAIPLPGDTGVALDQIFQVIFTEPVSNVSPTSVLLRKAGDEDSIPYELLGSGPEGAGPVTPSSIITGLIIRPLRGLELSTTYELVFTGDIVDTDEDPSGDPSPNSLSPDPTVLDFKTFSPGDLGRVDASEAMRVAVIGNRAFVARNTVNATVRVFDISYPVLPTQVGGSTPLWGIFPQITVEEGIDLGSGETDLLATLTTNTFSNQGVLEVFEVRGEDSPFEWKAVVTTNQGVPGTYASDVVLFKGWAYVAIGQGGLEVINLSRAAELLEREFILDVSRALGTRGAGFAQEAIENTIRIGPEGSQQTAATVAVKDTMDGRFAFVGSNHHLSSVDVSELVPLPVKQILPLSIVINEGDTLSMGWVYEVGFTSLGGRELAVVVGGPETGQTHGILAVVDISEPAEMEVLSVMELLGGAGASLSFDESGNTVYVGTSNGLEAYNLGDPTEPLLAGVVAGVSAEAVVSGNLAVSVDLEQGLKLAALDVIPLVGTDPPIFITDDELRVLHPGTFVLQVLPSDFQPATVEVELLSGDAAVSVVPGVMTEGRGTAPFGGGLELPLPGPLMRLVLNRNTPSQKSSFPIPVPFVPLMYNVSPVVSVDFLLDPINERLCFRHADPISYQLGLPARVKISIIADDEETLLFEGLQDPASNEGVPFDYFIGQSGRLGLFSPETEIHQFRIVAELPDDPEIRVERVGDFKVEVSTDSVLPVGRTFVKGVDLFDGHLAMSSTDVRIPGRGPDLEIVRSYGSGGSSADGPLGAGWTLNYFSTLVITDCFWMVRGGDGTGQRFTRVGDEFIPQKGYHTTLRENEDGTFDFFTKGRIRYHYNDIPLFDGDRTFAGRPTLEFIEDPDGNRLEIIYDGERNITEVKEVFADPSGEIQEERSLTFEYATVFGERRVSTINGPLDLRIEYQYDTYGNLVKATRAAAEPRIEEYGYTVDDSRDRHNMVSYTDPNQNVTEYEYYDDEDEFPGESDSVTVTKKYEWVKSVRELVEEPDDYATTGFVYDRTRVLSDNEFIARVTDARENITIYTLNSNGSPVEIEEPGEIVTTMDWAADDIYKTKETDAEDRVTRFEYDDNANLVKEIIETEAFGEVVTEFAYDPVFNKMTYRKDAEGRETFFEIDSANGRLNSVTDAEVNVTGYTYNLNGDLKKVTDPRQGITQFTYDPLGNPSTTIDPLSNTTTTIYDERSRLVSQTDTFGREMAQIFDDLDRVMRITRTDRKHSSDTEVIERRYYPGGQLKNETNGLGLKTEYFLDGQNRVEKTLDSLGFTTEMGYDGNGNVISKKDRRGVTTRNSYDELNRLTKVVMEEPGPLGDLEVSKFEYDKVGNKRFEWDIHNHKTEFVYDKLYRVQTKILPLEPYTEEFTYDRVGNKLTKTDANGNTTSFEYDGLNRLVLRRDAEQNELAFEYDEAGNPTLEADRTRGLETQTRYDSLNRPIRREISSEVDRFNYVTQFIYDDPIHTVAEIDPRGFSRTTELDGFDRVHKVSQETGSEMLVTTNYYDANGNLREVLDANERTTEFLYDGFNQLKLILHPLGFITQFQYDGEGNKIEEVNRRSVKATFSYDSLGRLVRTAVEPTITGVSNSTVIVYNDTNNSRNETDARGLTTIFEMDGLERVVKIIDPDLNTQSFVYDGVNRREETDKRDFTTRFEYDGINRLVKIIDAKDQELKTDYLDSARQVVDTDRRDIVKTTQLDSLGRLVSATRADVILEQHQYDPANNRTRSTDANGNKTKFEYDGANRLTKRTDGFETPEATTTTFTYDPVGNLLTEKDQRVTGKPFDIRNTYDDLNRLRSVEDGEGNTTQFEYDGEGNRTAQIEPEDQRTEFDCGELNELIEVRMADGGIFQYLYDPNRNRIKQIDAESNVVDFTYDNLNRLDLMIQDPTGFAYITDHDYDANGNETKLTDAKDQVIDFTYDELNRMTAKVYQLTPEDFALYTRTHRIDYGYDANDNLLQVDELRSSGTDPPATYSSFKFYDSLDRLTSESDTFGRTLLYGYDPQGNRTSLTDPDNIETTYTYDALNRLKTLTTEAGTTNYTYFPDGLKHTVTNPNNTISTFGYAAADRMTSISHQGPSGTVSAFTYTYTPNSNRETQVETNAGTTQTTSYTYDPVNRLQTVTYEDTTPNARTTTYEYDLVGNRKTEQETEVATSNILKDLEYNYDAINRLETIIDNVGDGDVAYGYDPNGNTTSKTKVGVTTTFKYDIRDQLSEVQQGTDILGRYGYDYDGRRILKIGADGRRHYTYDQLSVITEADETNATVSKYDYGLDQLVSLNNQSEGRSFFHLDALRSTVNLSDGFGNTRQSILFDAWGNERDRIGVSTNKFTFTGHELDEETGLVYAKARFYDPDIGRFLSQDSYMGRVGSPPSLHRYQYSLNNPLRFFDLTGFQSESVEEKWDDLEREAEAYLNSLPKKEREQLRKRAQSVPSGDLITQRDFEKRHRHEPSTTFSKELENNLKERTLATVTEANELVDKALDPPAKWVGEKIGEITEKVVRPGEPPKPSSSDEAIRKLAEVEKNIRLEDSPRERARAAAVGVQETAIEGSEILAEEGTKFALEGGTAKAVGGTLSAPGRFRKGTKMRRQNLRAFRGFDRPVKVTVRTRDGRLREVIYDPRLRGSKFRDPTSGEITRPPDFFTEVPESELKELVVDVSDEFKQIQRSEEVRRLLKEFGEGELAPALREGLKEILGKK